jgi:hypothetical protein
MSWLVIEMESENGERRYARVRPQVPMADPVVAGVVLLQTETWCGPNDGELRFVQVYAQAAEEILGAFEQH